MTAPLRIWRDTPNPWTLWHWECRPCVDLDGDNGIQHIARTHAAALDTALKHLAAWHTSEERPTLVPDR